MKMENGKEQWIDDVLGSTQGMSRAEAPANLYDRVMIGVQNPRSRSSLPVKQWAAAAVLLVAVNIASVVYFSKHGRGKAAETALAGQMTLETTYSY
jgi:hypothetical protein